MDRPETGWRPIIICGFSCAVNSCDRPREKGMIYCAPCGKAAGQAPVRQENLMHHLRR